MTNYFPSSDQTLTAKKSALLPLIYLALLLSLWARFSDILDLSTALKNIRFLAPMILLPLLTVKGNTLHRLYVRPFFSKLYVVYLIVIVYTVFASFLAFRHGFTYRNFVNIILLITPLIIADGISRVTTVEQHRKLIDFLFYSYLVVFFVELYVKGVSLANLLQVFNANLLVDSDFDSESDVSLILGPYAIYYFHNKRRLMGIVAIAFTLFSVKRIAIGALAVGLLVYYIIPILKLIKPKKKRYVLWGGLFMVFSFVLVNVWIMIITGEFDTIVESLTGVSINKFFMGRIERFQMLFHSWTETSAPGLGFGVGYIENILYYTLDFPKPLHNDFFRLYYEFGAILFGCFMYMLGYFNAKNRLTFAIIILLLVLMQTDNVFMYDRVVYSYYLIYSFTMKNSAKSSHA